MENPNQSKEFGYFFYPPDHPHDPGHPRLDIILRSSPTGQHFDPEQVRLPVALHNKDVELLTIKHLWAGDRDYRLVTGRIAMRDRKNKTVEAFTFGGSLSIEGNQEDTVCILKSPAPILDLRLEQSITGLLAQEVEVLLAERRGAWAGNPEVYEAQLAVVDPIDLYYSCLAALRDRFKHFPLGENEMNQRFMRFLNVESSNIHDVHIEKAQPRKLSDLL